MKKQLAVLMALLIALTMLPLSLHTAGAESENGAFGDNLKWSFNESTGTLTISGSGAMEDLGYYESDGTYCSTSAPWWDLPVQKAVISSGVTSIGNSVFSNCESMTSITIPSSVTRIGMRAFTGCTGLTSVTVPNSVTEIGEYAFSWCSGLTSLKLGTGVTKIEKSTFSGCSDLKSFTVPDTVTEICEYALSGCSGLTSLKLGSGVKTVGYAAFNGCSSLTSITIPANITSMDDCAFNYCVGLTKFSVASGNTKFCAVDGVLFSYDKKKLIAYPCSKLLTSYSVPEGVTSLGQIAFDDCVNLQTVTLPASLPTADAQSFLGSDSLTAIKVASGSKSLKSVDGILFSYNGKTLIAFPNGKTQTSYTVPNTVTVIGDYAFAYCNSFTSVTVPSSVTKIGEGAFYCGSLTSITVPNSVTEIGDRAFYYCTGATTLKLGSSVKTIGNSAFSNCNGLKTITVPDSVTAIGKGAFSSCTAVTSLKLGSGVKTIGEMAFYNCSGLTAFTIPSGVTKIEFGTFWNCAGLTSITVPENVTEIGDLAFSGCTALKTVKLGSKVKRIGLQAFWACNSLTSITVPDSVTEIGEDAFSNCTGMKTVKLGSGVRSIGRGAFYNCTGLTSVAIPDGVTVIREWTFADDESLKKIVLPASVTRIEERAFSACTGLQEITLPASITTIGEEAFVVCYNLRDVYYGGTSAQKSKIKIGSDNTDLTIAAWHYMITEQPKNATVKAGESTTFKVTATDATGYQWQYSKNNGTSWTDWSGKTTASLKVAGSATNNGCMYRCVISNAHGGATSTGAKLTVSDVKPAILTQPKAATVAVGKSTTLKVVAGGSGLSYQWQYSKNNGASWTNFSGKTSASLAITGSATNNGCLYRCVVKNSYGSVTSSSARLTVSGVKPVILTQPAAATVASGKSTTFKVVAAGAGLSYQWQYSKNNGASWTNWSGKTSATLKVTGSATNNGCLYRCVVKNTKGSVTSASAQLTVSGVKPAILVQPAAQTAAAGKTVTFKVVAAGTGLSYQWQYSTNSGKTWTNCKSGDYNKATFSFKVTASLNGRLYRCVVKNSSGTVNSVSAALKVN